MNISEMLVWLQEQRAKGLTDEEILALEDELQNINKDKIKIK
jgi:hypothetical protein